MVPYRERNPRSRSVIQSRRLPVSASKSPAIQRRRGSNQLLDLTSPGGWKTCIRTISPESSSVAKALANLISRPAPKWTSGVSAWLGAAQQLVPEVAHEPKDRWETAGIVADGVVESGSGETEPPFQKHMPRFDRGDLLHGVSARRLPGARVRDDMERRRPSEAGCAADMTAARTNRDRRAAGRAPYRNRPGKTARQNRAGNRRRAQLERHDVVSGINAGHSPIVRCRSRGRTRRTLLRRVFRSGGESARSSRRACSSSTPVLFAARRSKCARYRVGVAVKPLLQFGEGLAHPGLKHARIDPNGVRNLVPGLRSDPPLHASRPPTGGPTVRPRALGPTSTARLPKSKRGIFFSTSSNSSCSGPFSSSSAAAAFASTLPAFRAASWMADAICAARSAAACSSLFLMRSSPCLAPESQRQSVAAAVRIKPSAQSRSASVISMHIRSRLRNFAGGGSELRLQIPQLADVDGRGVPSDPERFSARLERRLHSQPKRADLPVQRLPRELRVTIVERKDLGVEPFFEEAAVLGLDADRMHRQAQDPSPSGYGPRRIEARAPDPPAPADPPCSTARRRGCRHRRASEPSPDRPAVRVEPASISTTPKSHRGR